MRPVLIFSGSNDRAIISFCRIAYAHNINIGIISNGNDDLIYHTKYRANIIGKREHNVLDLKQVLLFAEKLKAKFKSNDCFILPSTEYLNRFLNKHRAIFISNNITFGLCDDSIYCRISDKKAFIETCEIFGIRTPKVFDSSPKLDRYVIKPANYHAISSFQKPIIVDENTNPDLLARIDRKNALYQEYIGGKSIYLHLFISKDEKSYSSSQENFIQQNNGGSMILSKSADFHSNDELVNKYLNMLVNIGFFGIIMIEIKLFESAFYMIEANPRLWGPTQLLIDSNSPVIYEWINSNELTKYPIQYGEYKKNEIYLWSGGINQTKGNLMPILYDPACYTLEAVKKYNDFDIYNKSDTTELYKKQL